MDRIASLRSMFDASGRGLEIGPSYNPLVPKREGFQVEIVDHAPTQALRDKYRNEPGIDPRAIEEVDHVWDGRPLTEVIGRVDAYDYIVASHVIEHAPDLLGFLKECESLLKAHGVLVLAVPDKRRCFDVLRPLSTTGAVLQAHLERRRQHTPATAFDHVAYFATVEDRAGWGEGTAGDVVPAHDLNFARHVYDRSATSEEYFDFHAWIFCPSSFRMIVQDLHGTGALRLREDKFRLTPGIEFFTTLCRSGAGCDLSRRQLLLAAQQELQEFPDRSS